VVHAELPDPVAFRNKAGVPEWLLIKFKNYAEVF
jgi:hypothetical protein